MSDFNDDDLSQAILNSLRENYRKFNKDELITSY